MRRLSAALVLSALVLSLPATAVGAPPDRGTEDVVFLDCQELAAPDGRTVSLFAVVSQVSGSFGSLAVWSSTSQPFDDPPAAISADAEVSLSADASTLAASFEMWTFDESSEPPLGEFLGFAEISASLSPLGEPQVFDDRFREGNRQFRSSGTFQPFLVSGDVVLHDGVTVDLSSCGAGRAVYTFFSNNPAANVFRSQGVSLSCSWETADASVGLFATADRFGAFADVFVAVGDIFAFGFDDNPTLSERAFATSMDLVTEDDFETAVGTATASATLSATGERVRFMDRSGRSMSKFIGERLSVDGTLEVELDETIVLQMDDESCSATQGRSMELFVDPAGPKPRPLANDTPEGAIALRIGRSDRVVTGANAEEPEEPCVAGLDPETGEEFEYPITYTAWWTFTGTGSEVTVSTRQSDFDTIVGVYQLVDGELVQVACVDDVSEPEFSLQAEATVATEAGATYYIQAGGFGGSTGRLVVSLR